jgi:hypothetical protein
MTDAALEARLFPEAGTRQGPRRQVEPDWASIHRELKRKHVTLSILWYEYIARNPEGYRYSRFCELDRIWEGKLSVTMRQTHVGGDKLFVDYAGDTVPVIADRLTGEARQAQIFVAVTFCATSGTLTPAPIPSRPAHSKKPLGNRKRTIGVRRATCEPSRTRTEAVECVMRLGYGSAMKHPTPSDFVINVTDANVNVIFKPSGRFYTFGRLADPEDIARYGPLSRGLETHGGIDATGDYFEEEVARMAHTLAVKAVTTQGK